LFFTVKGVMAIAPHIYPNAKYNPLKDFKSITQVLLVPHILTATPNAPYNTMKEMVEYAKRNPGKIDYASAGVGSQPHIALEAWATRLGISFNHIPYKTNPGPDVMSGVVSMYLEASTTAIPSIKAGKIKALGISGAERIASLPDVPTMTEFSPTLDVNGVIGNSWHGVFTPASTPDAIVEQVVRPTGLIDPEVEVRPVRTQVDDVLSEIRATVAQQERVLVTTLTKRMSEDLTEYLQEHGVKVRYLHSDIETVERMEIIRDLRLGKFDVLVGINLLREGLDLPEVSLVAILDADKEGFLRSEMSLIQTIGRAARNVNGRAILYADSITGSMRRAMDETSRRRVRQIAYNTLHGITPRSIKKAVQDVMEGARSAEERGGVDLPLGVLKPAEIQKKIKKLEGEMMKLAKNLEFEQAARVRDEIGRLREAELALRS
jgi:hypothetical protein